MKIIVTTVATAAARFVFMKASEAWNASAPSAMEAVDPPLKPNQQNHRMKTPSATAIMLCPGIALTLPSRSYLPILGPSIHAPRHAITPPTLCTTALPAKS